jgi:DNA topoisomerase-1
MPSGQAATIAQPFWHRNCSYAAPDEEYRATLFEEGSVAATEQFDEYAESAKAAGLRHSSDDRPGITRRKRGDGFVYVDPQGRQIDDERTIRRINNLRIPPAYTDVWIATDPRGHLQATGRDARGRKQYRYHPKWSAVRDETKFARMIDFGKALPKLRERTRHDIARHGLPREKVLATVVQLLEKTLIRVGNEEYARENKSYGLTTLRNRHAKATESSLRFAFRGKSGIEHQITLQDRRLARIVRQLRDLPGQELFQYVDEDGTRQSIDSTDVNAYLHEITGQEFTAKDFRTWAGTVLCAVTLREFDACSSETEAKKNIVAAVKLVSHRLGNTPSVCRKSYIHPAILAGYLDGSMFRTLHDIAAETLGADGAGLTEEEAALLTLLADHAKAVS